LHPHPLQCLFSAEFSLLQVIQVLETDDNDDPRAHETHTVSWCGRPDLNLHPKSQLVCVVWWCAHTQKSSDYDARTTRRLCREFLQEVTGQKRGAYFWVGGPSCRICGGRLTFKTRTPRQSGAFNAPRYPHTRKRIT
jgi:hypothetical protein